MKSNDAPLLEPSFLSAPKVATLSGVSRNTVCCWIRGGKLASYRTPGGKNLIRPSDLIDFMERHNMFVSPSLEDMATKEGPAQTAEEDRERTTSSEPAILVVDDNKDARTTAVRSLKKISLPILEAETGYEALHLLVQHPEIALVILDLIMPGQHGTKTLNEIKKSNEGIPVIVVTGVPPENLSDNGFGEHKPDLIISKPYQPEQLSQAAQTYLADLGF